MSMSTMSVAKDAMLNVRLTPEMQDRIMAVIQATGGEVTRTALVERSLDMFLRVLELEPTMIPNITPGRTCPSRKRARRNTQWQGRFHKPKNAPQSDQD